MEKTDLMKEALFSLIRDIHHSLDQTNIYSIHIHRPQSDSVFMNMGKDNQLAKDRINKLISDCGKMKDYINACVNGLGQIILNNNKDTVAVLHNLCNYIKHPDPATQSDPQPKGNFKPSLGDVEVTTVCSAAGIIYGKNTAFWDIGEEGSARIAIDADVLREDGALHKRFVPLVKESLEIWKKELKKNGIEIPEYKELDPMQEAAKYGQHGSLFVESYDDALAKAYILKSEKRFQAAVTLYNWALTKCKNEEQRAKCYFCLGLCYEDADEFNMAISSYMTALKYNPYLRGLNLNFGRLCNLVGDKTNANIGFQNELKLPDGDHVNAYIKLSEFEKNQGDIESAIAYIQSALALDTNSKIANDMYAEYMKASA